MQFDLDALIAQPGSHFSIKDRPTSAVPLNSSSSTKAQRRSLDKSLKKSLKKSTKQFSTQQRRLYADNRYSLLLVFQAMDAAGKDSTIRAISKGVNPAGFQVHSFKQPSKNELDHDFLWRSATRLPERGRIGIFNRSYYEETLVVRVHPEYLGGQNIPKLPKLDQLWSQRYQSINAHEKHLVDNGTIVLKFWLNVSLQEQKKRFLDRLNTPEKNWKFSGGDLKERKLWPQYMQAYEEMINATSTQHAPWHVIPADNKAWMRVAIAKIVVKKLKQLDLHYPAPDNLDQFENFRNQLLDED